MTDRVTRRTGVRFVMELPPQASMVCVGDALIVAAPGAPPVIIRSGQAPREIVL